MMRYRKEVRLGRQPIGRVAPGGVGESPELPAFYKRFDAVATPPKRAALD